MIKEKLAGLVRDAIEAGRREGALPVAEIPEIEIERPREKAHGDFATNIALVLAGSLGMPAVEVARTIAKHVGADTRHVSSVEVAGPGFINFRVSNEWLYEVLEEIEERGERYGWGNAGRGEKVQVEFVSANPVGPMHIGHGRWAAVGDTLANVMEAAGYRVEREFYINDFGTQMNVFAKSVAARYCELLGQAVEFPEEGYRGAYIYDIAREIIADEGDAYLDVSGEQRERVFLERAYRQVLDHMEKTLERMDVRFDEWFSERALHESSRVKKTIEELRKKGFVYDAEGAVWFRATAFGEEKDRVLVRENGDPTYFAADIAYHKDKLERGFDRIIDIWGADHHGYVARMKAAIQALGRPADTLEVVLGQLVTLSRGGEPVRMSKRTGELVTLEELLAEVGKDPVRFFFLMRSTDTSMDFDIELAKRESSENPVYYVQYAHARINSILKYGISRGVDVEAMPEYKLLADEPELSLIRKLAEWPEIIERAALQRAPYQLTKYAQDLAASFHNFYTKCRVITDDRSLTAARLGLVKASRTVLRGVLGRLGVEAPESM